MIKSKHCGQVIAFLIVISLGACGGSGNNSREQVTYVNTGLKSTLQETLDEYLEANFQQDEPGMSILVVEQGQVKYNNARGAANLPNNTGINSDTGFRLASVSKSFTALAVIQLYEQSLITLDSSILDYLPELPDSWQSMTIHHLLTHQSGIKDYNLGPSQDGQTNQDILNFYTTHDALDFQPGSNKAYSNPGYHLLAEIVERVSGIRFEDYMQQNIFTPLSMTNTYVADEYTSPGFNDALNHAQFIKFFGQDNFTNGANGVVSSLNDMHLFIQGLLADEIVSQQSLALMLEHHTLQLFGVNDYGYGFAVVPGDSDPFFHSGRHDGFVTFMYLNRIKDRHIVFLGNGGDTTNNHDYLFDLINQSLDGR